MVVYIIKWQKISPRYIYKTTEIKHTDKDGTNIPGWIHIKMNEEFIITTRNELSNCFGPQPSPIQYTIVIKYNSNEIYLFH